MEFWYEYPDKEAHNALFQHVRHVEEDQKHIHDANLMHAKLYSNRELMGMDWGTGLVRGMGRPLGAVSENVIQSVIDTATSLIAKAQPKATIVTDGAEWELQRKASDLDMFLYSEFRRCGLYHAGPKVFRDSLIFGTGFIKVYADGGKLCVERIMPDEVIVDERECISGPPVQMFHRRPVDRETLKALYPEFADDIEKSQTGDDWKWTTYRTTDSKQVVLVEAWLLPTEERKGRHILCTDCVTIVDEEWKHECFPIIELMWSEPIAGYYGQGLAEQLKGIQLRINKLNKFIDRAQELVAKPRFLIPHGSRVKDTHLTSDTGTIIHYTGQKPPTVWTGQAVTAEVFQRLESLKRSAFEFAGISQLSAASLKPAGLESGVALREYSDIETARFAIQSQRYEEWFLRIAYAMLMVAKEIYKTGSVTKAWDGHNLVKQIPWQDVDMEDDRFVMKIEASSVLAKTPAGRKSDITDLLAMGALTPEDVPRLLAHPDIKAHDDLENSFKEEAEAIVTNMLNGIDEIPDTLSNLAYTIAYVQKAYLHYKRKGAPENILDLFRDFIANAGDTLAASQPPPPPMGMTEMGAPPEEGAPSGQGPI